MAQSLHRCRRFRAINCGKSIHSHLVKSGILRDVFFANNLMAMYIDSGFPDEAHQLFGEIPERNVVSWTTLISAYSHVGRPSEALRLFTQMLELKLEMPNSFTLSAALKACALAKNIEVGKSIHRHICGAQLQYDTILMNSLLDMYVKCGSLCNAQDVFDSISLPNLTSWNTLIAGYCSKGLMEEAVNLFQQIPEPDLISWNTVIAGYAHMESQEAVELMCMMHRAGVKFDHFTFPCVLKTCGFLRFVTMGEQIHCYLIKSGIEFGQFIGSAVIDMYSKCSQVSKAMKLFYEHLGYKEFIHDKVVLWNSIISGCASNKYNSATLALVSRFHSSGMLLNSYIFGSILKVCINLLNLRCGTQVHGLIITCGYHLDSVIGSILTELYATCGSIEDALQMFWRLPEKDVVAWTGLISGCAQQGSNLLAFSLFKEMVYLNVGVDQFVISSVLKACSSLAGLEGGKQVHAYCVKSGYESETIIDTSLIDMYSKCGEIDDGLAVFKHMDVRDAICWTGIIVGCGRNGRAKEAIEFFQVMLKEGVKPNEITFLGVLSACRHAGLVGEAFGIFRSMSVDHGLVPRLEHYCCMVDLLSQAGCFEVAKRLISDMPYEPDETIWGSLLGACVSHNNVELGKWVAELLVSKSPDDASVYVTLSNVYASLGMWDCSTKLREVIREVCLKEAGRSWIEVKS